MSIFHIDANGTDMGEYRASSREDALDLYADDAGYRDWSALCAEVGEDDGVIVTEIDTDALVRAVEKQLGVAVFQGSFGGCVALVNNQSIDTYVELAALIDEHPASFAA